MPPVMDLTPEQHAEIARQREAQQKDRVSASRHLETQEKLQKTPEVFEKNIRDLIEYFEDLGNQREITNFPESIKTPDVEKVSQAVEKLSTSVSNAKVDTKPILESLKRLESLLDGLPKDHAEQKEEVKVSNLKELADILKDLDSSVKNIKMVAKAPDVKVNVPAPVVNVEKTDIEPLRQAILELTADIILKEVPNFEPTDTSQIEKELKQANKYLKDFLDKPMGGGGGGGGMVSYKGPDGSSIQVTTEADGSVPVTLKGTTGGDLLTETTFKARIPTNGQKAKSGSVPVVLASDSDPLPVTSTTTNYTTRIDTTTTANMIYIGNAVIGASNAGAVWQIKRIDKSTLALDKRWADGDALFDNVWNNRASLSYS